MLAPLSEARTLDWEWATPIMGSAPCPAAVAVLRGSAWMRRPLFVSEDSRDFLLARPVISWVGVGDPPVCPAFPLGFLARVPTVGVDRSGAGGRWLGHGRVVEGGELLLPGPVAGLVQ